MKALGPSAATSTARGHGRSHFLTPSLWSSGCVKRQREARMTVSRRSPKRYPRGSRASPSANAQSFHRRPKSESPTLAQRTSPTPSCTARPWRLQQRHAGGPFIGTTANTYSAKQRLQSPVETSTPFSVRWGDQLDRRGRPLTSSRQPRLSPPQRAANDNQTRSPTARISSRPLLLVTTPSRSL